MSDPASPSPDATVLLNAAAGGDATAVNDLLALVYGQLRVAAQMQMAGERPGHTLSATALVHEAYLKLVGPRDVPWRDRAHFYAAAAQAMRRILLDHARKRGRRGGGPAPLTEVADVAALVAGDPDRIVAVDEAVRRLEERDPEAGAVVRLRFYAGLSVREAAQSLGMSERTAERLWTYARAALFRALSG